MIKFSLTEGADRPERNEALIVALALDKRPQWEIASRAGFSPSLLSMFANGHLLPNRDQAESLAAELGYRQVDKLFPRTRTPGDPVRRTRP